VIAGGGGLHCPTLRLLEARIAQGLQAAAQAALSGALLRRLVASEVGREWPVGRQHTTTVLSHTAGVGRCRRRRSPVQTERGPILVRRELVHALDVAVEGPEGSRANMALHAFIVIDGQHAKLTKDGRDLAEFRQPIPRLVPPAAATPSAPTALVAGVPAARVRPHDRHLA
jgi:hypothetical protein